MWLLRTRWGAFGGEYSPPFIEGICSSVRNRHPKRLAGNIPRPSLKAVGNAAANQLLRLVWRGIFPALH